jgi:ribonuclease P protein component
LQLNSTSVGRATGRGRPDHGVIGRRWDERQQHERVADKSVSERPKARFPKSAHLLKHADFQKVYQQGRRHFSGNMTVFYLCTHVDRTASASAPGEMCAHRGVRVGFTVSKALGGAVDRNRMRRRTREAVRHHLRMLDGVPEAVDVVINPKRSLLAAEFAQISQEIERAFRTIRQSCERGTKAREQRS